MDRNKQTYKDDTSRLSRSELKTEPINRIAAPREAASRKAPTISHEAIARRAYEIYVSRKRRDGFAAQDWRRLKKNCGNR